MASECSETALCVQPRNCKNLFTSRSLKTEEFHHSGLDFAEPESTSCLADSNRRSALRAWRSMLRHYKEQLRGAALLTQRR